MLKSSIIGKLCVGFLFGAVLLSQSHTAQATHCYYISTPDQGDWDHMWGGNGWQCQQQFIDYWWSAFGFEKDYWDEGMGWDDCCNIDQPLARTFNALWALGYSSTGSPNCDTNASNMTLWAMCYAAAFTDKTRAYCGSGTANGTAADSENKEMNLFWPFFYGYTTATRASIVFHESRHGSGCNHNGGSSCPNGTSCDISINNGCAEYTGNGADTFQAFYLSYYAQTAWRTTAGLKQSAVALANDLMSSFYVQATCLRFDSSGFGYWIC
jgi:hypothetical protein